jgi:hypothetical protein
MGRLFGCLCGCIEKGFSGLILLIVLLALSCAIIDGVLRVIFL